MIFEENNQIKLDAHWKCVYLASYYEIEIYTVSNQKQMQFNLNSWTQSDEISKVSKKQILFKIVEAENDNLKKKVKKTEKKV